MRPAVRFAPIVFLLAIIALPAFGGPIDNLHLVDVTSVDATRANAVLQRDDVRNVRDAVEAAGFQFDASKLRLSEDANGMLVPLQRTAPRELTATAQGEHTTGPAFMYYQRATLAGTTPLLLVTMTGIDASERPYVEFQLPTTALRLTAIGETFDAQEIPVIDGAPSSNVAASIARRVVTNDWNFGTIKQCFLSALGLSDLSQLTGLITAYCTLSSGTKDILDIAEEGSSCVSLGALSCVYFVSNLAQFLTCGANSVVSCVNATQAVPDTQIGNNQTLSGTLNSGQWHYYFITLPANVSTLTALTGSTNGNVGLYMKAGAKPTLTSYDVRSATSGSNESCVRNSPVAGQWWIGVYAASATTFSINVKYVVQTVFTIRGFSGTANATVTATRTFANYGTVMADGLGNYTIPNLPAGTYTVTPTHGNCSFTPLSRSVTVPPDAVAGFLASCSTPQGYIQLNNGVARTSQSVAQGGWLYYWILIPSVMSRLDVRITGTGDADLYTQYGSLPTANLFMCRSVAVGTSTESCTNTSVLGTYWIGVRGIKASTLTITATYQ